MPSFGGDNLAGLPRYTVNENDFERFAADSGRMRAVWIAIFVAMYAADAVFFEGRHTAIVVAGAHEYGDDFNRHIDDLLRLLRR
jgi:hypothetical protein